MPTPSGADVSPNAFVAPRASADAAPPATPSSGQRLAALFALIRWPNALIAAAAVVLGAFVAGAVTPATWLAALAAFALTAVANAVNDVYDREIDLVAHPSRPLPRAALSIAAAVRVAALAAAVGLAASFLAAPALAALSAMVLVAMVAYSHSLKRQGLPGNLLVAVVASLPFAYGAVTAGRPLVGLGLVAVAAPLHFAREVAKDLEDLEADLGRRRTLPIAHGDRAARAAVAVAAGLFALLALRYFAAARWATLAPLAAALVSAASGTLGVVRGRRGAPRVFKGAMLLAMAAAALDALLGHR